MWFVVVVIALIFIGIFRDIINPERVKERTRKLEEQSKSSKEKFNEDMKAYYKEKEGLNFIKLIYQNNVWGIEEDYGKIENISLFDDRVRFKGRFKNRDLMFSDIDDVEVLTDTQIEQKSKVGQMMLIGAFALVTKPKTEEVVKRKLVINASENDIKFSVIIDTLYDSLTVAKDLNQIIKEYKTNLKSDMN